ncbi:MAG: DNA repair protein RadA [Sphingomonadaceae bacterium]
MPKNRTKYVCDRCGAESLKWMGRCPECGEWNTLVEMTESPATTRSIVRAGGGGAPTRLSEVPSVGLDRVRVPTGELDRVLGGGIVPGSLVLVGGDPGIGKSTLLLQLSSAMADQLGTALYVSGEESVQQVKMRAERLGLKSEGLYLLSECNLDRIIEHVGRLSPGLVVIDSIQSVFVEDLPSTAGSVNQLRECTARLLMLAKGSGIPVFLVGHVTKEGAIAGPKLLEHMVDAVLYLEGERFHAYRLLRSVKNRFGSTHEVGVFEMHEEGMLEVPNPSVAFLADRTLMRSGSTVVVTVEGSRALLAEIQALTSYSPSHMPRRNANGIELSRVLLLTAVLSKRLGLKLYDQDVYVNVVGGLRIDEPAADLGVALAIVSSLKDSPIDPELAVVGEVGLSGELRGVGHLEQRLREAAKLGFKRCLVPQAVRLPRVPELQLLVARSLEEAIALSLG